MVVFQAKKLRSIVVMVQNVHVGLATINHHDKAYFFAVPVWTAQFILIILLHGEAT